CVNATVSQSFTLDRSQDGFFTVLGISTVPPPFSVTAPTTPAPIGSGFTFTASAMPKAPGTVSGAFQIMTDIPNDPPRNIMLSVPGLASGVNTVPNVWDFGPAQVGGHSDDQPFVVTNCGSNSVTLTGATFSGDSADFAVDSGQTSGDLGAGSSVT